MKDEFYHIGAGGEGEAGPFETLEAATADAEHYLHGGRWGIPEIKIVKVLATSKTETVNTTTWEKA